MDLKKNFYIGDFLDHSVDLFKTNYKKYFCLVLIFHVPVMFLIGLLMGNSNILINELNPLVDETTMLSDYITYQLGSFLNSMYSLIFLNVLSIAVIRMTYDLIIYNKTVKSRNMIKYGFGKFGWLILSNLIQGGIAIAGFIIIFFTLSVVFFASSMSALSIFFIIIISIGAIVVASYFSTRFSLTSAAISIDGISLIKAFKVSYRMTKGRFWKTFLSMFFGSMLVGFCTEVFTIIVLVIPFTSELISRILFAVTSGLAGLFFPYIFIVQGLMYTKYKAESGELDFQLELDRMFANQH